MRNGILPKELKLMPDQIAKGMTWEQISRTLGPDSNREVGKSFYDGFKKEYDKRPKPPPPPPTTADCGSCGSTNSVKAKFCAECGEAMSTKAPVAEKSEPPKNETAKEKKIREIKEKKAAAEAAAKGEAPADDTGFDKELEPSDGLPPVKGVSKL